jgi:hypothetical protein
MNQLATMAAPHRQALEPTTLTEAMEFARLLANSTMVPREFQGKPGNVLIALQWGREVGLGPLQAVQNIAVINGRPSLWGDAMLALVRGHPACAAVREGVAGDGDTRHGWCEVTRRGEPPQRRTFSVADAKRAKLWGKAGPWTEYPDRMLQLRARGFATRDVFPDALRGVITAEEAADMPPARGPTIMGEAAPAPAPAAREEPQGAPDHPPPERLPMISPHVARRRRARALAPGGCRRGARVASRDGAAHRIGGADQRCGDGGAVRGADRGAAWRGPRAGRCGG